MTQGRQNMPLTAGAGQLNHPEGFEALTEVPGGRAGDTQEVGGGRLTHECAETRTPPHPTPTHSETIEGT